MQFKIFAIPVTDDGAAIEEMNMAICWTIIKSVNFSTPSARCHYMDLYRMQDTKVLRVQ